MDSTSVPCGPTLLTRIALPILFLFPAAVYAQAAPKRFPSPHGKYVVEAVTRDPGGVGAPQTIVSLHRSRNKVATYRDNILVVDGEHPIAVRWEPGDTLAVTISCEDCDLDHAVLKVGKVEEIPITFRTHASELKFGPTTPVAELPAH